MRSWRNPTLQLLWLFLCRPHLTEANCNESLQPTYWKDINFSNLTNRIPLVDAQSFEDMIQCTLWEMKDGALGHLWGDCMEDEPAPTNCSNVHQEDVSFMDFMCLVAKAFKLNSSACSHDVVIKVYSRYNLAPFATTLPTTKQPPTTAKLTTTVGQSTTAEKSTKPSPPQATTWSTSPSASSTAPPYTTEDVSNHNKQQANKEVTDRVVYSLLGLSVLVNLVLAFCVALLCSRTRFNSGTSVNESPSSSAQVEQPLMDLPSEETDPRPAA